MNRFPISFHYPSDGILDGGCAYPINTPVGVSIGMVVDGGYAYPTI